MSVLFTMPVSVHDAPASKYFPTGDGFMLIFCAHTRVTVGEKVSVTAAALTVNVWSTEPESKVPDAAIDPVMVTVPGAMKLTTPVLETVAIAQLLDDHD